MVSLTPRYWRRVPASAIQAAPSEKPAAHSSVVPIRLPGSGMMYGTAAAARPPSTSAPSPPMMMSPARAGSATHSAVSISGAARVKVFCHENQSPNAPLNSSAQVSTGLTPPSQTNRPNSSKAPISAPIGSRASTRLLRTGRPSLRSHRADHAFDEIVHLLEFGVGLLQRLARWNHDRALVALEPAGEDVERARDHFCLDIIGHLLGRVRHHRAIGRHLHVAFLEPAAQEVRVRLAGLR